MNNSQQEFIEKPLWARLTLGLPLIGRLDRRDLMRHETSLVAYAVIAFALSFAVPRVEFPFWNLTTVDAVHFSAFSALLLAYVASVTLRLRDTYNTWATTSS